MKMRIMVFGCLLLLIAAGVFYITQREQTPTGLATGRTFDTETVNILGKVIYVGGRTTDDSISFMAEDNAGNKYWFDCDNVLLVPVIVAAYHTQSICDIRSRSEMEAGYYYLYAISFGTEYSETVTNADLMEEIKDAGSDIDNVKNWLRWIWRYVYRTYRRVR